MWPWSSRQVQQPVKYHGLINQGSTCYLNSVLQVLFMTKEFREAVNRFVEKNPDTEFIDRHLKDLFDDLLKHQSYTYKIIKALGIDRVHEQQDAAEYFERIIGQASPNTAEIFHGQTAHRTTCSVCKTQTDIDGPFWHLPLELVDSSSGNYSVEDGINTYFMPTYFREDNQMYCDTCDTKVNATSRYVIKHHPDVLILLLKRFDFSYRYMSYVKINRAVDVPYTLTVPENQTYELYGVVDHFGDLRSGHYIAQIKSQEDEETWYSFDDTRVSQLDSSPFPDSVNITQSQSAYLLFYRKKVQQPVKFHGLINHGSTCYLNSVLQVLFMTKEFREAVNRFVEENPDTEFIDRHLKDLFDDLLKHQAYTYKIINALGIVRVSEQQNAAEYFEKILKLTSPNTAEMFHGQMAHRTTCSVCETESDRDRDFWHLPLDLVNSNGGNFSVEEGITTLFTASEFRENQMYCDTCETKFDSRYVIKHHPDVLVLLLKRFVFSIFYMSDVKINCAVDVPYTLTVPEKQTYELYGVVDHFGDLRSGHYIAQIKSQEDEETWYSFDDTKVAALDSSPFLDSVNITQFQNAYLLFYKKKDTQEKGEISTNGNDITERSSETIAIQKEGNDTETQNKAKKRNSSTEITEKDEVADKKKKKETMKDPEKSDVPEADQDTSGKGENKTENSDSHSQKDMMKDEDTEGQGQDRTLPSSGDQNKPTERKDLKPGLNQDFTLGHRETSVEPAAAAESEEKRTSSEQFVVPAGHGSEVEMKDFKRKSMDKTSEENPVEKKGKHETENSESPAGNMEVKNLEAEDQEENKNLPLTKDQSELKESENHKRPETENMRPAVSHDFKPLERKKSTLPSVHDRHDETGDGQSLLDEKTEDRRKKQETDNSDSHLQDMTSQEENTNDQEEKGSMSSTGDEHKVKDPETSDQHEVDQMRPDMRHESKPVDSEKLSSPAGHDGQDEMSDAQRREMNVTDENKLTKKEVKHETENLASYSQNMQNLMVDDHKGNRNLLSDEDQNKVSDPMKAGLPETKEMKQEKRETENSDGLSENSLSEDKNTDDLKEDGDLLSDEDQAEVRNLERAKETEVENMKANQNQEKNRNQPSTGDQIKVKDLEKSDRSEADKVTPGEKENEIENSNSHSQKDMMKDEDTEGQGDDRLLPSSGDQNKPTEREDLKPDVNQDFTLRHRETSVGPPGHNRPDEQSDAQKKLTGEDKQTEKKAKYKTENSVRQAERETVKNEDSHHQKVKQKAYSAFYDYFISSINKSENKEPTGFEEERTNCEQFVVTAGHDGHDEMTGLKRKSTDKKSEENQAGKKIKQETQNPESPVIEVKHPEAVHDRHDETGDGQSLLDEKTEDRRTKQETDNSDSHLQDMTSQEENTNDQEEKSNKSSTGDQNNVSDPMKEALPKTKEIKSDVKQEKRSSENNLSKDKNTDDLKEDSDLVSDKDQAEVLEKTNETGIENMRANLNQEENRSLPSTGDQIEVKDPKKSDRPEANQKTPDVKQDFKFVVHENVPLSASSNELDELNDALKNLTIEKTERTEKEEKRETGISNFNSQNKTVKYSDVDQEELEHTEPAINQPGDFEMTVEPAALHSGDERSDVQESIDGKKDENKQVETSLKHETENSVRKTEDMRVKDEDQIKDGDILSDGELNEVKDSDNNLTETKEMKAANHDFKPEDGETSAGHERQEDMGHSHGDLTDEMTEEKIKQESEKSPLPAQDTMVKDANSDECKKEENLPSSGDHNVVKGQITLNMKLDSKPVDGDLKEDNNLVSDEDQADVRDFDKTKENEVEKVRLNMNQEENRNLPSTGDQSEVKNPEKSDRPEALDEKTEETENCDSDLQDMTSQEENTDDQEEKGNMSSPGDESKVKDPETSEMTPDMRHESKPVDSESLSSPAGHDRQDERSDAQRREMDGTDENKLTKKEVKHETRNSDFSSQTVKDSDINQEEGRNLLPTGDLNELKDAEKSDLPESSQMTPEIEGDSKPGVVHRTVMDLTAEENKQTEGKTVKDEDPYNQEENQKVVSTGDQNKDKHPENKEPTGFVEERTNCEQFVVTAGQDGHDEMTGLKRKSTDKKSEENQAGKKIKQETENPESPVIEVKHPEAEDQEENKNLPLTKDQSELKESENHKQPETENMRPDVKPVERKESTLPSVHDRHDETGDGQSLLDEKTEDRRTKQETDNSDSHLQDMTSQEENTNDQEEKSNKSSTGDQNNVSDPMKEALPKAKEIKSDVKQERSSENNLSKDKNTDDLKQDSDLVSDKDQAEVLEKTNETGIENINQEENKSLPSTGDKSEVKDPEKSDRPEADQKTPDVKQDFKFVVHENVPLSASSNELDELNDALKNLTIEKNERTEKEEKRETGISNFNSQNKTVKYSDVDQEELEHTEPAINQPGDFEMIVEPAALHSGDERSDVQESIDGKKDENKQVETSLKHETENSVRKTEDMRVKDEDQIKDGGDLNEVKDSDNNLTETKEMKSANCEFKPEDGETSAGHERQEDMGHSHGDLTDEMTEEKIKQESEKSPLPAQDTTVKDANSDECKKEENLSSSGDHNVVKGQITLNMKLDSKPVDGDLKEDNNLVSDEDQADVRDFDKTKENEVEKVRLNMNQEENRNLPSTGDQSEVKNPEKSDRPEALDEKTENSNSHLQNMTSQEENTDDQEEKGNMSSTGDESKVKDPETSEMTPDMRHESKPVDSESLSSPAGHDRQDERSDAQRREMDITDENKLTKNSLDVPSQENNTDQDQNRNLLEDQNKDKDPRNKEPTEFKNKRPNINHDVKPGDGETSEHDREEIHAQDDLNNEVSGGDVLNKETEMTDRHSQDMILEEDDEEKRNLLPAEDQNEAKDPESKEVVEFVQMSLDVSRGSKPLGSERSAVPAVHYKKNMADGKENLGNVTTKENQQHKQDVTVMVDDQEEIRNLLSTENKDPETAAPPEAQTTHDTRKCKILIGLVTLFLILFIVAALCIYFLIL